MIFECSFYLGIHMLLFWEKYSKKMLSSKLILLLCLGTYNISILYMFRVISWYWPNTWSYRLVPISICSLIIFLVILGSVSWSTAWFTGTVLVLPLMETSIGLTFKSFMYCVKYDVVYIYELLEKFITTRPYKPVLMIFL